MTVAGKIKKCYACLFVVLLSSVDIDSASHVPNITDQIVKYLFRNYKNHERPTDNMDNPTKVIVYITILAITKVDVINMEYTLDMYLRQRWLDTRLSWQHHPTHGSYDKSISIPSKKKELWLPDLFFRNGKKGYVHEMTVPNYLIRVETNGSTLYSQKVTMSFACQMQLQTFPMDTQTCHMNIGSYGYTTDSLLFMWRGHEPVLLSSEMQISEFNTPNVVATEDCTKGSATQTGRYACLKATFVLQRQIGSYLTGTYIPSVLVIVVSWLSFWVSIEAVPARITLGLLTLLGILTQSSSVVSSLPRVAYIKAIDVWMIACIVFVIGALIEFAVASFRFRQKQQDTLRMEIRSIVQVEMLNFLQNSSTAPLLENNENYGTFHKRIEGLISHAVNSCDVDNRQLSSRSQLQRESEIDAYSRFLFPASFVLYSCGYWFYYLILVGYV